MGTMDTIGARIKAARIEKGYTMKQLQELTGLSTGNISCLENNRYAPSVSALLPLKEALGCSIDWLLSGEDIQKSRTTPLGNGNQPADEMLDSQIEKDLVSMFRVLSKHDKDNVFDFVTMLYEKAIGKKGSVASTYTADELKRTSESGANDEGQSGIA